jgi:putative SOS response-associated peptidase YedK
MVDEDRAPGHHIPSMCGRITQKSPPNQLGLKIVDLIEPSHDVENPTARFNGAPSISKHWVIRRQPETGNDRLDRLWWGLIPHWVKDENGGRKPINAKAETVSQLPSFRGAYAKRRCIVPVDNFRVAADQGPGPETALRRRHERRLAVRTGWNMGELAKTGDQCVGAHLRHHHHGSE